MRSDARRAGAAPRNGGIVGVGDEASAVASTVVLVVMVLISSETSGW